MVESAALYAIASLIVIPFEAVASTGTNVRFGTAYAEVVFSAAAVSIASLASWSQSLFTEASGV
jgi:hypothetical protein